MKNLFIILFALIWTVTHVDDSKAQTARRDSLMFEVSPGNWLSYSQMTGYTTINPLVDEIRWRSASNGMIGATSAYALPISTATQTALNGKQATLTAGTGISIVSNVISTTATSRVFNNNVSRSLNSNYTISTTRDANVTYSMTVSYALNALLSGSAAAFLEYSTNGGSSWITVSQVGKTLSLLTIGGADDLNLNGNIPSNALVRIRTTSTNMTISYLRGSETYL